ncbi:hypothetical protein GGS23DRAFT_615879 [Durotheca rogersii]|uniref:uncharacterized protein n=1 Tax=Durotheca rogersii TaxID=419775 RepID=UPI00221F6876|nr:uncharacterized protein GGS23DRAFT_615879 [Durotheca rogersii]KAI5859692.1 hypothetical protein GGS23DRAFT_615879 [Durotheca rogersii]
MKVSSFDGSVTKEGLQSFNDFAATLRPGESNLGNEWAQGHSGEHTKAMGLVYQLVGQQATLDQMLRFCDAVLSQRNDLTKSPMGQHKVWTGRIDPAWPNNVTANPIVTGGEQGDPVEHLANCAYLILKTGSLRSQKVTIGDPHRYGATYMDRAKTYLQEADFAISNHILSSLLDLSGGNKMYFAKDSPYMGGKPVPWNQQMMFNYAFMNLCGAHRILKDNPKLLVKPAGGGGGSNHGSLDVAGFYRAYIDGNYAITADRMKPFANTFVDVMTLGDKKWAGRVNGESARGHASSTLHRERLSVPACQYVRIIDLSCLTTPSRVDSLAM